MHKIKVDSWCFKPSQPQRIISGLRETFIKRPLVVQGTVKGGRKQGGQRKRWEDNIREWTGLEVGKSLREVKNRENGENWLQNHLWCPYDPRGKGIDDDDDDDDRSSDCTAEDIAPALRKSSGQVTPLAATVWSPA